MLSIIINVIGFFQSLFLGSVLMLTSKYNNKISPLEGLLVLLFAIPIFNSIRILVWNPSFLNGYEVFSNYSLLFIGPTLYLLTKNRIKPSGLNKSALYHFTPFFILFPLQVISLQFPQTFFPQLVEIGSGIIFILLTSGYLIRTIQLVRKQTKLLDGSLLITIYGFFMVWHLNLVIQFLEAVSDQVKEEAQIFSTLTLSALIMVLTYKHWMELIRKLYAPKSKLKLAPAKVQVILKKLQTEMSSSKPYLQNNYSLQQLSFRIKEPRSYISHVINKEYKISFPKYIARLRVQEFVAKAKHTPNHHLSIQGLANEVGFNSPSTFNKAFNENMKMRPSDFIKSLKES